MDGATLKLAFGRSDLDDTSAGILAAELSAALRAGGMTTVNRVAMFCAQLREESVGLRYVRELDNAAGTYLKGQPYWPYIGRTYIQITWKYNYAAFGAWCAAKGLLRDPNYFLTNLAALESGTWKWLGPVWFFTTHGLNAFADQGDITGASYRINGGDHGLQARILYWNQIRSLGARLLPDPPAAQSIEEEVMGFYKDRAEFEATVRAIVRTELNKGATVNAIRGNDNNDADPSLHDPHYPETIFMGIPGYQSVATREAAAAAKKP